jgi:hypothetical protein
MADLLRREKFLDKKGRNYFAPGWELCQRNFTDEGEGALPISFK